MHFINKYKDMIRGISLLVFMLTPFGMYVVAEKGWNAPLIPMLVIMSLGMLAILISE